MYPAFGTVSWITPYGLMLVVALFSCWLYARRRALVFGVGVSHVDLAVPLVFAISLLGAEVLALINPRDTWFAGEMLQAHARFRLFGLLLIGLPVLYGYSRLANLSFKRLLDLFALPVLLWLALVRVGCFLAGCCWGDLDREYAAVAALDPQLSLQILTLPWLSGDGLPFPVSFPADSLAHQQHLALALIGSGAEASLPVHPTQLYELVLLLMLLYFLTRMEIQVRQDGILALIALGSYGILRFLIEFLRADNSLVMGSLTFQQLICVALLLVCVSCIPVIKRNR